MQLTVFGTVKVSQCKKYKEKSDITDLLSSEIYSWGFVAAEEMDQEDRSPLKHFVVAKKKINEIFEQLLDYAQEGSEFVKGEISLTLKWWSAYFRLCLISFTLVSPDTCQNKSLEQIANKSQMEKVEAYTEKLEIIKEVLARRHMKVAFFGRLVVHQSNDDLFRFWSFFHIVIWP